MLTLIGLSLFALASPPAMQSTTVNDKAIVLKDCTLLLVTPETSKQVKAFAKARKAKSPKGQVIVVIDLHSVPFFMRSKAKKKLKARASTAAKNTLWVADFKGDITKRYGSKDKKPSIVTLDSHGQVKERRLITDKKGK